MTDTTDRGDLEAARAFAQYVAGVADAALARLARIDGELDELAHQLEMLAPSADGDKRQDELFIMAGAIYRLRTHIPAVLAGIAAELRDHAAGEPAAAPAKLRLVAATARLDEPQKSSAARRARNRRQAQAWQRKADRR